MTKQKALHALRRIDFILHDGIIYPNEKIDAIRKTLALIRDKLYAKGKKK